MLTTEPAPKGQELMNRQKRCTLTTAAALAMILMPLAPLTAQVVKTMTIGGDDITASTMIAASITVAGSI